MTEPRPPGRPRKHPLAAVVDLPPDGWTVDALGFVHFVPASRGRKATLIIIKEKDDG